MEPYMLAWTPGPLELVLILGVGLLVFGRRLPDIARSVGKSVVEFKRGLNDVKDDVNTSGSEAPRSLPTDDTSPR